MFKIFVSDGVQDGFLTHSYETLESCLNAITFIKPDLIELGYQAICLFQ